MQARSSLYLNIIGFNIQKSIAILQLSPCQKVVNSCSNFIGQNLPITIELGGV